MMCFSIGSPTSFANITSKWVPELRHHCPHTPIVLVGTKQDLREDPDHLAMLQIKGLKPVSYTEGIKLAREVGQVRPSKSTPTPTPTAVAV